MPREKQVLITQVPPYSGEASGLAALAFLLFPYSLFLFLGHMAVHYSSRAEVTVHDGCCVGSCVVQVTRPS